MKDRVQTKNLGRIRDPNGVWLTPTLFHVLDRDEHGRATSGRFFYDDAQINLGELAGPERKTVEFLLVWMTGEQLRGKR